MTVYSDFLATVKKWLVHPEYEDDLLDSFVRIAEATISDTLRTRFNTSSSVHTVLASFNSFNIEDNNKGYISIYEGGDRASTYHYKTPETYFASESKTRIYTIENETVYVGNTLDVDRDFSTKWYCALTPFVDVATPVFTNYYNVYLFSTLAAGYIYAEEMDRGATMSTMANELMLKANEVNSTTAISGSVIKKRIPRRIG